MWRVGKILFSSRFAQRIFLLFVSVAFAPIVVVAMLSFDHVSKQLYEQSYEQSRQTSKAVGMELFRRLSLASTELEQIAETLGSRLTGNWNAMQLTADIHVQNLSSLAIIEKDGTMSLLQGVQDHLPELSKKQQQALVAGKTMIHLHQLEDHVKEVILARPLDARDPASGVIIGKVNAGLLWSVRNLLPSSTELAILMPANDIVYSSRPSNGSLTDKIVPLLAESISGHFQWDVDGSTYLASYWSVFTDMDFSIPYLVIVASQPEGDVLAPIADFRNIYVPLLVVAVLAVSFVAARQLRKSLAPLVVLRDATRNIANGQLNTKVTITSHDEFAQLGESFNLMAARLEKQFASLSTMAEIDQLILSSFDARYIIETVLGRAAELTPCAVAAILEIEDENSGIGRLSMRINKPAAETVETHVILARGEKLFLDDKPDGLLIDQVSDLPSCLQSLSQDTGASTFLLFPIYIKKRLAAVLAMGYVTQHANNGLNEGQLRKFADHVAVALSNADWEERLYHQAHYDALTNLPNRALLKDRLEQAIARAQRNRSYVGVMFLDLDRFKLVNDSLGHDVGDQLLIQTAQALQTNVRSVDTVVRFGGDEFVVIIPDIDQSGEVVSELGGIADKIIASNPGEFIIDNHNVHSGMSIGIALYPKDGETPDELIKNADTAMYHAKEQGRDRYEFFAPELNEAASRRLSLEHELRRALENREFDIHYQTKIDSQSGKLVGVEALIRWMHPEKGLILPSEFIPVAEETGLIDRIGDRVLSMVCQQMKKWCDAGLPHIRMAVNVSPRQFRKSDFPVRVAEILKSSQLDPTVLELEVTEGSVMENIDEAIEKLNILNAMGVHLSIDDFGTGYSSLSYLKNLPIHSLKIDQTFILDMIDDQNTQAIVASTIYLAHQLGLSVVAEGVETGEQRKLLETWRCDVLQGYLFGAPLPGHQFETLLGQSKGEEKELLPKVYG
jgi:diguanylate cyclase (GGDEF)-like protein